jgi:hypothetical protein
MMDWAESPHASENFDYDAIDVAFGERAKESPSHSLEPLRRIFSYINSKERARMTVHCICFAIGIFELESENRAYNGPVTMTDLAKLHGVTKAAISRRVREVQEELGLRPTRANKSENARRNYARTNCSPIRLGD